MSFNNILWTVDKLINSAHQFLGLVIILYCPGMITFLYMINSLLPIQHLSQFEELHFLKMISKIIYNSTSEPDNIKGHAVDY